MRIIEVLGSGCPNCQAVERTVREALAATGVEAEVRKVTEYREIAARGVLSTPGLAIDGQLVSTGRIPTLQQVIGWLQPAAART
jgi:small redox-active disulfide protein 2